jgi:hypothetical protein
MCSVTIQWVGDQRLETGDEESAAVPNKKSGPERYQDRSFIKKETIL